MPARNEVPAAAGTVSSTWDAPRIMAIQNVEREHARDYCRIYPAI
jgi:hypothetical protein